MIVVFLDGPSPAREEILDFFIFISSDRYISAS